MRESKKRKKILTFIIILVIFSVIVNRYTSISYNTITVTQYNSEDELQIHIIDVGQAESILIVQDGFTMLVDSGDNFTGDDVVKYIKNLGIDKIDIFLITHFHRDHAGGAHKIISSLDVKKIVCHKFSDLSTMQERFWYIDMSISRSIRETFGSMSIFMESACENNKLKNFDVGDAKVYTLSQNNDAVNVNNKSIVFKLVYGDFSMLFMADAESEVEKELLEEDADLSADVLKIGHHGSKTSTTDEFLDKVNPKYAVVSCGNGNDYNHPYGAVTKRFEDKNIPLYRTDELGDIVITVKDDGEIVFDKENGDYLSGRQLRESNWGKGVRNHTFFSLFLL